MRETEAKKIYVQLSRPTQQIHIQQMHAPTQQQLNINQKAVIGSEK